MTVVAVAEIIVIFINMLGHNEDVRLLEEARKENERLYTLLTVIHWAVANAVDSIRRTTIETQRGAGFRALSTIQKLVRSYLDDKPPAAKSDIKEFQRLAREFR